MNRIITGDCRDVMSTLEADSFDAIITDPPYHLTQLSRGGHARTNNPETPHGRTRIGDKGFMGKNWDGGDIAHDPAVWFAALRVAKPGAHLLAFGGTRTFHRLMVAIEDAGWELRDTIMWVYGSGFPKSHNLEGKWEGWGTALKPAWEPIIVARKPLVGTVATNVTQHGTGAMNIEACRIETADELCVGSGGLLSHLRDGKPYPNGRNGEASADRRYTESGCTDFAAKPGPRGGDPLGRWPANLIHDGSEQVLAVFPDAPGQMGNVSGNEPSVPAKNVYGTYGRSPASNLRGDFGSAARFFYCAKADRQDRDEGLEGREKKPLLWSSGDKNPGSFQAEGTDRSARNFHPTVKPTALMRYLCKLVTPPGGAILDPFAGSGSTGKAAMLEGFSFIGIEQEAEYAEIAEARIAHVDPSAMVLA